MMGDAGKRREGEEAVVRRVVVLRVLEPVRGFDPNFPS